MAAQAGSDILIQVEDDDSPASYATIGGMRTRSINLNGESIDVTNDDSGNWTELLDGEGIRSIEVSCSGVFTDGTSFDVVHDAWEANTLLNYKLTIPDYKTIQCKFKVTSLSHGGEYNGEATWDLTLMSSGAPAFADI